VGFWAMDPYGHPRIGFSCFHLVSSLSDLSQLNIGVSNICLQFGTLPHAGAYANSVWVVGYIVFSLVVIMNNLKLFTFAKSYNLALILSVFASIAVYFLFFWVFNLFPGNESFSIFEMYNHNYRNT
jgi:hypothetical protein